MEVRIIYRTCPPAAAGLEFAGLLRREQQAVVVPAWRGPSGWSPHEPYYRTDVDGMVVRDRR